VRELSVTCPPSRSVVLDALGQNKNAQTDQGHEKLNMRLGRSDKPTPGGSCWGVWVWVAMGGVGTYAHVWQRRNRKHRRYSNAHLICCCHMNDNHNVCHRHHPMLGPVLKGQ
jgi:hypothetical protein